MPCRVFFARTTECLHSNTANPASRDFPGISPETRLFQGGGDGFDQRRRFLFGTDIVVNTGAQTAHGYGDFRFLDRYGVENIDGQPFQFQEIPGFPDKFVFFLPVAASSSALRRIRRERDAKQYVFTLPERLFVDLSPIKFTLVSNTAIMMNRPDIIITSVPSEIELRNIYRRACWS